MADQTLLFPTLNAASALGAGDSDAVTKIIVDYLAQLSRLKIQRLDATHAQSIAGSVEAIRFLFAQEQLNFSRSQIQKFLGFHQILSNLAQIGEGIGGGPYSVRSLPKMRRCPALLAFVSVRSGFRIGTEDAIAIDPMIGSEWYGQYFFGVRSFPKQTQVDLLREHLTDWSTNLRLLPSVSNGYMRSTYIDPTLDRVWKFKFNQLVRAGLQKTRIDNVPNPNKIAVLTARWAKMHPTYKNRYSLFKRLAEEFDLTLVHLGPKRDDLETDIFKEVRHVQLNSKGLDLSAIRQNDFGCAFYPDIGMNIESRFISNLRLAPYQFTTNSHPVSTFGSEIDFFVTGRESESDSLREIAHYYSERPILIPGIGTRPEKPNLPEIVLARKNSRVSKVSSGPTELKIACPWGCLKLNPGLIDLLRDIQEKSRAKVTFRLLMTLGSDNNHFITLQEDLHALLGRDSVELYADLPYSDYLQMFSECTLALDAYPFGGNTSIVDAIAIGVPIVTREGWQFYNKAGAVILRRAGLYQDLVAHSTNSQIAKVLALIEDPNHYHTVLAKLQSCDVAGLLEGLTSDEALVRTIKFTLENAPSPTERLPIEIT